MIQGYVWVEAAEILELTQPYTLVGHPVKRPVLAPLAVYSSRTVYKYVTKIGIGKNDFVTQVHKYTSHRECRVTERERGGVVKKAQICVTSLINAP